jgi:hypothetical protein
MKLAAQGDAGHFTYKPATPPELERKLEAGELRS